MAQSRNINVIPNSAITRVHVSQGDVGRTIYFNLYEGSLAYTPTSGDVITCVGTKPSGLGFTVTCTWSGNVVTCVTTEEMTDESGSIDAELVITSSDESTVLGTSNFVLVVEKNPHPSDTTDGTQTTAQSLQVQIDDLNTRVTTLESSSSGSGLTDDIKVALLQIAEKVAYIDENGQTYYDDLYDALYPPVTLSSITCVYTQSGTVYDNASLSDLTSDLVVTAHYDDSSTSTVSSSDYILSGTLSVGTSTITVAYGGKTTTFTVTVTASPTLSSITATYTQSGTVSASDTLDSLKSDLVVTATWSDSTTTTVSSDDYTLSGTLSQGTSTITVTYGGQTTTFTVEVSESGLLYSLASLTTTTTDGSEEVDTGINPLDYDDLTVAFTIDEVTEFTWTKYAVFGGGTTSSASAFELSTSGNGNINLYVGSATGLTVNSSGLIDSYSTSLANAPLIFTFSGINTSSVECNAYGYVDGDVVTASRTFTQGNTTTARNIYIAPTTSHAYSILKSFMGTLSNFKIYNRILTTDEINSYFTGA